MESVFEATVTRTDDGSVVVMSGTVNRAAKQALEAAYEEAVEQPGRVLMDFRSVDYINSTGIAVIVGVLAMARAEDREVGAFGLTDHYREVFSITRLSDFTTIYDDETAAVAAGRGEEHHADSQCHDERGRPLPGYGSSTSKGRSQDSPRRRSTPPMRKRPRAASTLSS